MAYAFMRTMVQTRSKGHTATGAACYRMGLAAASTIPGADGLERRFDYTRRTGILATGHAAPPGTDPSWGDPITWAHRIEAVDKRKNSRQCRDDVVGIPVELVEAGLGKVVAQAYADRLAKKHKTVVHWALHGPTRGGKNYHVHFLYPGRHVEGMTLARKRDRTQDNPEQPGDPDLVTEHKGFWSEICRGYGIELDWTSEAPGHHLGPALCAVKRARLVEETRERIRETVAASTPGEPAPGERTLQVVAETATRVNDGLTVTEMLEREQQEALHGRSAPRPVPAPGPFQPEVLPAARTIPKVLLPVRQPEVLLLARTAPEVVPAVRTAPEVLPPCRQTPQVLPPVRRPEVLRPVRRQAEVSPPEPVVTAMIAAPTEEEHPGESAATWSAVEDLLEQQRQQTRAHERARAAARELSGRARSRASHQPPAQPNRIQRLAGWLLNCAQRVLEHLGMKPQHVLEERPVPAPERPPRHPGTVRRGEVDGVGRREPAPAAERVAAKRPRQPELPALVAAMNRELLGRAQWCNDEHSMLQMLNWATGDITGKVRHWKSASLAEQPRILDRADLLCVSGWMVGRALAVSPIAPAQETIRTAAQEIAADPKLNDWQRRVAAGVASGQVHTYYKAHASVAEEEQQMTDHLLAAKREAAAEKANQQTAAALEEWNAKKWLRGRKPEPVRPAEPDPPTPAEIQDFRQEVFQSVKKGMQEDILEKFSEPIRDVVDRAFERGELPVSRPAPPRTPTRGRDPGRTM